MPDENENAVVVPLIAIETLLDYLLPQVRERQGMRETPLRYLKALERFIEGYAAPKDLTSLLKVFEDGAEHLGPDPGMVVQRDIPFWSLCEHHLLPFWGVAHIGYVPNGRIIGLSKMPRLVEVFARRFQVQERLGAQVADALMDHVKPKGVGVVLECRHSCMESRGVEKAGTVTMTSALRGVFLDPAPRAEFMALAKRDRPL